MIIEIDPVAKPRMTSGSKWTRRAQKYFAFRDELNLKAGNYKVGERIKVIFVVPMPKSWSKKKKAEMNTKPHKQRPDADNYLKAFLDALCEEDSHVWDAHAIKIWGYEGKIIVNEVY